MILPTHAELEHGRDDATAITNTMLMNLLFDENMPSRLAVS